MSKGAAAVREAGTLSVLTLNIWGLWLVSKRRSERVRCACKQPGVAGAAQLWQDDGQAVWVQQPRHHITPLVRVCLLFVSTLLLLQAPV